MDVEPTDQGHHEQHRHEHDRRVAAHLGPGGPGDLAHLGADLAKVLRGGRALFLLGGSRARGARRGALLVERAHLLELALLFPVQVHCHGRTRRRKTWREGRCRHGRRDSNPRPSVLETDALPAELLPFVGGAPGYQGPPRSAAAPPAGCATGACRSPPGRLPTASPCGRCGAGRGSSTSSSPGARGR